MFILNIHGDNLCYLNTVKILYDGEIWRGINTPAPMYQYNKLFDKLLYLHPLCKKK